MIHERGLLSDHSGVSPGIEVPLSNYPYVRGHQEQFVREDILRSVRSIPLRDIQLQLAILHLYAS
jgi:hypothetical protein